MSDFMITGSAREIHALLFGPARSQSERDREEIRGCLRRFRQLRAISHAYGEHVTHGCVAAHALRLRVSELVARIRRAEG